MTFEHVEGCPATGMRHPENITYLQSIGVCICASAVAQNGGSRVAGGCMNYFNDRTLGDIRTLTCPHCGVENTDHAGPEPGARLQPGNVGICAYCGGVGVFTALGVFRKPTEEEHAEIESDPEVREARHALAESYGAIQATELLWSKRS